MKKDAESLAAMPDTEVSMQESQDTEEVKLEQPEESK